MRILLVGCSGFLGSALTKVLASHGHTLTLVAHQHSPLQLPNAHIVTWDSPWEDLLPEMDAIVNLAGSPLAQGRWTRERKRVLLESRLMVTRRIASRLSKKDVHSISWLNASAVGFYGDGGEAILNENSPRGSGFLSDVCYKWERATRLPANTNVRRILLRTGIVLGRKGGFLPGQARLFRWGLGGRVGDGSQYVPWIHLRDWANAVTFILEHNDISGPVNLVAPNAISQREFAHELGRSLNRPALLAMPARALRFLLGEMSSLLLEGQNAKPMVLLDHGFQFSHPLLQETLDDLLKN